MDQKRHETITIRQSPTQMANGNQLPWSSRSSTTPTKLPGRKPPWHCQTPYTFLTTNEVAPPCNPWNVSVSVGRHSLKQARAEVEILVSAALALVNDRGLPGHTRGRVPNGDGRPAFWIVVGVGAGRVVHHGHGDCNDRFLVGALDAAGADTGLVVGNVT